MCELDKCCFSVGYCLQNGAVSKHFLLLKPYLPFAGYMESLMQKKGKATEKRNSMIKCRKMSFGGKDLVKIPWDSAGIRVI